jgi:hypothetical protein
MVYAIRIFAAATALSVFTTLVGCHSRPAYEAEFTREFGNVGLTLGTIKALDAGKTDRAYHLNLIYLKESFARAEELSRASDDDHAMVKSNSKVILNHLEKFKERLAEKAATSNLALEITTLLIRTLDAGEDLKRAESLREFFAGKFVDERRTLEELNKD